MTGLQELEDEILGLEAELHGKRMELSMAKGDRVEAETHMRAMNHVIKERRAFRINCEPARGRCFFDAMGERDAAAMKGGARG